MEWRFYFVERGYAPSKRMVERRTAVVQVADSNGFILVIQIYDMNRMSFLLAFPLTLNQLKIDRDLLLIGFPIELQVAQYFYHRWIWKK